MPRSVYLAELGCAKNTVDAEVMRRALHARGYGLVEDPAAAEVIVVNTCSFLEEAVNQSIDTILAMARHKDGGACRGLIVAGCLGSRYGNELLDRLPEADAVISSSEAARVAEACDQVLDGRRFYWEDDPDGRDVAAHVARVHSRSQPWAYVKISEGCDHPCSFCIIPEIRGAFRSRPLEAVVGEVQSLTEQGVREINLVAQDSTAYGMPETGRSQLPDLLQALDEQTAAEWVRVFYAYPYGVDDALMACLVDLPSVVPYLDLPVQHIDDAVLRAMRRKGSERFVRRLIATLRDRIPGLVLRTTLIVGFPGETDAQFERLLTFVAEGAFDRLGVFTYSPERGTPAAELPGAVPADVAQERYDRIMVAQQDVSRRRHEALVGDTVDVLLEGVDPDDPARWIGRSYRDAPEVDGQVYVAAHDGLRAGEIVPVTIQMADPYDLAGEAPVTAPLA